MTPDDRVHDEKLERELSEQDDPTLTTRVSRTGSTEEESKPVETSPAEAPAASIGIVQQIWRRIKEERSRPKRVEINTRGQNNMDRSKAFLVLATAVVLCGFAFLALFSTSSSEKRAQDRRTKPSLGRPESATTQQAGPSGSTIPLLSADQGAGEQNAEQLSPDDILATSRRAQTGNQQPPAKAPNEYALNQVPPVNDPALKAYRRQNNYAYTPPPPPPPTTAVAAVPQPVNESEGLKKSSLVFVRNTPSTTVMNASQSTARPVIERKGVSTLLPTGSRLVARLQTAVSSAVKT